ncbi:MAG TPA: hypothetical protein VIM14_16355 [Polyangia bacterium]|jgi:hypothetical protein
MDTTVGDEQERKQEPKQEPKNEGSDELRPSIEELKERIVSLNDRAQGFIKEHPAACLLGALGLGYLFARMARRRS